MFKFLLTSLLLVLFFSGCGSDPISTDTDETSATAVSTGSTPASEVEKQESEQLFSDSGSGATSGQKASGADTNQMGKQTFETAVFE